MLADGDDRAIHASSAGRAARQSVRRRDHAEWDAPSQRGDPVAVLREQDATRIPGLVPIRHGRMTADPFASYRGAGAIMAHTTSP
ncbi:DUF2252 family protein [Egicoccus sp. AB-alg2]|uniref:DUF2252 family protein n=1 Tax=Egicoccus sp. AB-alg2 TaxID=3242693 RepID=UPI00359DBE5D